LKDSTMTKA